jgi:hypothetical protein
MQSPDIHRKELQEMGSPLADMTRETPFQVPPDYFRQSLKEVMARIHDSSDRANDTPEAELRSLSPLLAAADKNMPFFPPDAISVPRQLLSIIREPNRSGNLSPADAPQPPSSVRRLPPLRAAAALLILGATAWFLRTQIPSAEPPAMEATTQVQPTGMDSINNQALDGFMRDTEVVTAAFETIGTEVAWTDAFEDISSGNRSVLDSELASLPEASLMAYVYETGIHPERP